MRRDTEKMISTLRRQDKIRVMFVCLGNICRSPAAHGIFESMARGDARFEVESSGLYHGHRGELPDSRMRRHASARGYSLTHRAQPFRSTFFDDYDLIVGMDEANLDALRRMAPNVEACAKVVPMSDFVRNHHGYDHIPDPYYEGAEGFELVLDLLEDGCANLYEMLK